MDKFPFNINSQAYSLIAVAIGYIISDNYNTNEQNSIGNWLILVGQYILTHASQEQLINSHRNNNCNDINLIKDAINKINNELNKIKK